MREMNLHHPRCSKFLANQAYYECALIAQLLIRAIQHRMLPEEAPRGYVIRHLMRTVLGKPVGNNPEVRSLELRAEMDLLCLGSIRRARYELTKVDGATVLLTPRRLAPCEESCSSPDQHVRKLQKPSFMLAIWPKTSQIHSCVPTTPDTTLFLRAIVGVPRLKFGLQQR